MRMALIGAALALYGCAMRARVVDFSVTVLKRDAADAAKQAADNLAIARLLLGAGRSVEQVRHHLELRGVAPREAERLALLAQANTEDKTE